MHGDDKEVVALSSDDINKLAGIAVDYKAADGKTRNFRPFDKVEDTADMINATTKTLGITFPAESMKLLTNILEPIPGPGRQYRLTATAGGLDGEYSFENGRLMVDGRNAYEAAREKSPLAFDSNLGFRVEIDRKYNIYRQEQPGISGDRAFSFEIRLVRKEETEEA